MLIAYIIPIITIFSILLPGWFLPTIMPATLPFGVRIPEEQTSHPIIAHARRDYQTGIIVIAVIVVAVSRFGVTHNSTLITSTGSILATILLISLNYYAAHKRIAEAKARENWYQGLHQVIMTDTSLHSNPTRPSWIWLVLSIAILLFTILMAVVRYPALPAIIPTHFAENGRPDGWMNKSMGVFLLPMTNLLMTAFLVFLAYKLPNTRQQLDPAHPEEDKKYQRKYRKVMANMLLMITVFLNLTFCITSLITFQAIPASGLLLQAIIMLVPIISIAGIFAITWQIRAERPRPAAGATSRYTMRDDDRYWKGGMLYSNPDDPALWVEKRAGIGWTINVGHPQAKIIIIAFCLVIAFITIAPMIFAH